MAAIRVLLLLFLNFGFYIVLTAAERDFYATLQIQKNANTNEIKRAYRKLAKAYHPDKNKDDPEANRKFQDITAAYEVLSDPNKRESYDRCGEECVKKDDSMSGGGGGDPFASFFSGFDFHFGGDSHQEREIPKGFTIIMDIYVTLEELYVGKFVELTRNKLVPKPAKGTRKCNCRQEVVTRHLGSGRLQVSQQAVCSECPNVKMINEEKILEMEIEPGMKDGQETRFIAEGEPHIDGDAGDLILKIRTEPHSIFERIGDDLYTNITISMQDALIGFTLDITHLDGHKVKIVREKVTKPGARIRKKGEGMPNYENNHVRGTLYVTVDVAFPEKEFSSEDKEVIKKLLEQSPVNRVYNGIRGS